MKNDKFENIYLKLVSNDEDWMKCFRLNIGILKSYLGWSARYLAEKADMSEHSLNNIIQSKTKDCDMSNAIKIAKALGVSIDELIGAKTISEQTRINLAKIRVLEPHNQKTIDIYINHQYVLHVNKNSPAKEISVINPICFERKMKRNSLADDKIALDKLSKDIQNKIGLGIRIPCDHYEPYFLKDEIILLGYDREGENNEMCVVSYNGNIYICIKKVQFENGKKEINYIAITNKKKMFSFDDIDDRFGYVVGFLHPDGTWGER